MNYGIIAIIIGPLVAVFTVYLEYRKDKKDLWLKQHYASIISIIKP